MPNETIRETVIEDCRCSSSFVGPVWIQCRRMFHGAVVRPFTKGDCVLTELILGGSSRLCRLIEFRGFTETDLKGRLCRLSRKRRASIHSWWRKIIERTTLLLGWQQPTIYFGYMADLPHFVQLSSLQNNASQHYNVDYPARGNLFIIDGIRRTRTAQTIGSRRCR